MVLLHPKLRKDMKLEHNLILPEWSLNHPKKIVIFNSLLQTDERLGEVNQIYLTLYGLKQKSLK